MHPHSRGTLATYRAGYGAELVEVPLRDGVTDADALAARVGPDTSRGHPPAAELPRRGGGPGAAGRGRGGRGARRSAPATRCRSAILRPPGELGVDVAVGEGQSLGNRLDYGGPSFGFFAAAERAHPPDAGPHRRRDRDVDGRRGFVLTLQTREQHIRREKATSNICTAQALNALAGVIYLSLARQARARSSWPS